MFAKGVAHVRGRRVAGASKPASRGALRGKLRDDASALYDSGMPAQGDGHTHEERAARDAHRYAYKRVDAG